MQDLSIVQDSVTSAVHQLFKDTGRLPQFPFKTLLQTLLRDETLQDKRPTVTGYMDIPVHERTVTEGFKVVALGDSGYVTCSHLVKLVTTQTLQSFQFMHRQLMEALGPRSNNLSTDQIQASFFEVFSIESCISTKTTSFKSAVLPQHRFEMTIEAYIEGRIEECISVFTGRILDNFASLQQSSNVLMIHLCATIDRREESFELQQLVDQRSMILTLLKAAILSEGDIIVEFYLKLSLTNSNSSNSTTQAVHARVLPDLDDTDPLEYFSLVTLRYRLSCMDTHTRITRCFSSQAISSLQLGVFTSLPDALQYLQIFYKFIQQMDVSSIIVQYEKIGWSSSIMGSSMSSSGIGSNGSNGSKLSMMELRTLEVFREAHISRLCLHIIDQWNDGLMVDVSRQLLCLLCILYADSVPIVESVPAAVSKSMTMATTNTTTTTIVEPVNVVQSLHTLTYGMQQATSLLMSYSCHIRCVRGIVNNLSHCISLIQSRLIQSAVISKMLLGHSLSITEVEQIGQMQAIMDAFHPCCRLLRGMVLDAIKCSDHSEADYLAPHLHHLVLGLFDPMNPSKSLLWNMKVSSKLNHQLLHTINRKLSSIIQILSKINGVLRMLEISIAMDDLMTTFRTDMLSYQHSYEVDILSHGSRGMLGSLAAIAAAAAVLVSASTSTVPFIKERRIEELPRCMLDLVGFISCRMEFVSSLLTSSNGRYDRLLSSDYHALFKWKPLMLSESLRSELIHDVQQFMFEAPRVDRMMKMKMNEKREVASSHHQHHHHQWWDLYGLQGEIDWDRCDGIDFNAFIRDEERRDEVHPAMLTVGTRARYLKETQVLQALHESMFELSCACPENRRSFSLFNSMLFRYILRNQDSDVSMSLIESCLFHPARDNRIIAWNNKSKAMSDKRSYDGRDKSNLPTVNRSSLEYIPVTGLPSRMTSMVGSVYGLNRIITGLGVNVDRIFFNLWRIPPFMAHTPECRDDIDIYCGVSLQTALMWCKPHMHRLRSLQTAQATRVVASLRTTADTRYRVDPYFEYHAVDVDATRDEKTGAYGGLFGRKNKTKKERLRSSIVVIDGDLSNVGVIGGDLSNIASLNDGPSAVKASKFCDSDDEEFNMNSDGDADLDLGTTHCSIILILLYSMINRSLSSMSVISTASYISIGHLESFSPIELEVVMRVSSIRSTEHLNDVRDLFAKEVIRSCQLMKTDRNWTMNSVEIATINTNDQSSIVHRVFDRLSLHDEEHGERRYSDLQRCLSKSGCAVVKAGMLIADRSMRLKRKEMVSVFNSLLRENEETTANATILFSDTNRLWTNSPVSLAIAAAAAAKLKHKQSLRPDGSHCGYIYVPCHIRFTLLAKLSGSSNNNIIRSNQPKNSPKKIDPQVVKSTVFPKGDYSLTIGDDSDVARLVVSTLWLSDKAASRVWQSIMTKEQMQNNTNNGINEAMCVNHRLDQLSKDYHCHINGGSICQAYLSALSMSFLTQNYQLSTTLYRSLDYPSFKLNDSIGLIELCEHLLIGSSLPSPSSSSSLSSSSSSSSSSGVHIADLWHTISIYICSCLRYFILSPQVAHLRGGCVYILKALQSLEVMLNPSSSFLPRPGGRTDDDDDDDDDTAANYGVKNNCSSISMRKNIRPPQDQLDFESALSSSSSSPSSASSSNNNNASRVITMRSDSISTDTVVRSDTITDDESIAMDKILAYRFILSLPKMKSRLVGLLCELRHMLSALLMALSYDMQSSFPEIALSLGNRSSSSTTTSSSSSTTTSSLSSVQSIIPARVHMMIPSEQVYKIVTGYPTCSIDTLLSFIARSATPMNRILNMEDSSSLLGHNGSKEGMGDDEYHETLLVKSEAVAVQKLMMVERFSVRYQTKEGQRDQLSMLSPEDKQLLDSILASGTIATEGCSVSRSFNRMDQWSMIIQEKVMKDDFMTKNNNNNNNNNNNKMVMMMDKSDSIDDATISTVAKEEEVVVEVVASTVSLSDASKPIVTAEDGVQKEAIKDAPLANVNALSTVLETKEEDDNDDDDDVGKVDRRRDDIDRRDDSSDRRDGDEKEEVEVEYIYQPKVVHNIKLSRFYDEMKEKREKELTYIYRDEKVVVEFPIEAAMMEENLIDAEGSQATVQRFSYHGFRDKSKRAAINVPSSSSSSSSTSQREGESMLQLLRMQGGVSSSSLALGGTDDTVDGSGSDRSVLMAYRHLAKHSPAKSQQIYYSQDLDDDDNDDDDNEDYSVDYTVNDDAAAAEDKNYGQERARYNHQHHRVVSDQVDDDDDPFM